MTDYSASIPVAAAAPVVPLLIGPRHHGTVLGVFGAAAILGIDTPHGPRAVSLLTRVASGVPNGVRAPVDLGAFAALTSGDRVTIGDRELRCGRLPAFTFARTWTTAVPSIHPDRRAVRLLAERLASAPLGVAESRVNALAAAVAAGEPAHAVRGLVGLGHGLTPGGDDILAGLMIGLRASGAVVLLQVVRRGIGADVADRSTLLSVDLLRLAARGHASLEVLRLLRFLHRPAMSDDGVDEWDRAATIDAAIDNLLAVGHTSGADLATGMLIGISPAGTNATALPAAQGAGRLRTQPVDRSIQP